MLQLVVFFSVLLLVEIVVIYYGLSLFGVACYIYVLFVGLVFVVCCFVLLFVVICRRLLFFVVLFGVVRC